MTNECRRRDDRGICEIDGLPCFEPCEFFEPEVG